MESIGQLVGPTRLAVGTWQFGNAFTARAILAIQGMGARDAKVKLVEMKVAKKPATLACTHNDKASMFALFPWPVDCDAVEHPAILAAVAPGGTPGAESFCHSRLISRSFCCNSFSCPRTLKVDRGGHNLPFRSQGSFLSGFTRVV